MPWPTVVCLSHYDWKGRKDMDGHKLNKKELVPIIALLVFIVVILILCAISAGRNAGTKESAAAMESRGISILFMSFTSFIPYISNIHIIFICFLL